MFFFPSLRTPVFLTFISTFIQYATVYNNRLRNGERTAFFFFSIFYFYTFSVISIMRFLRKSHVISLRACVREFDSGEDFFFFGDAGWGGGVGVENHGYVLQYHL